jgi:hypothetical protein
MKRLLLATIALVLLSFGFASAGPTVYSYGSSWCTGSGSTGTRCTTAETVTMSATPVVNDEFLLVYYYNSNTAPSLSGSWTTECYESNASDGYFGMYVRPVVSGDTGSTTVTVLTNKATYTALFEVTGYSSIDAANCAVTTSASSITPSATAAGGASLGVADGAAGGGASVSITQCTGYTSTISGAYGGSSYFYAGVGGYKTNLPAGTQSCTISSSATYIEGGIVLFHGVAPSSWQPFGIWRRSYCGLWPDAMLPNLGF